MIKKGNVTLFGTLYTSIFFPLGIILIFPKQWLFVLAMNALCISFMVLIIRSEIYKRTSEFVTMKINPFKLPVMRPIVKKIFISLALVSAVISFLSVSRFVNDPENRIWFTVGYVFGFNVFVEIFRGTYFGWWKKYSPENTMEAMRWLNISLLSALISTSVIFGFFYLIIPLPILFTLSLQIFMISLIARWVLERYKASVIPKIPSFWSIYFFLMAVVGVLMMMFSGITYGIEVWREVAVMLSYIILWMILQSVAEVALTPIGKRRFA